MRGVLIDTSVWVSHFRVRNERLHGLGCGIVDFILLASTVISPYVELWTLDKRLELLCGRFGVNHKVTLH
ncbi:MAG: hypothetical protein NTX67_13215 [Burkholderiales bacterium]|jgi:hypothetical protein|nr:hypothetical protein [Burkholderiales bacterium]